MSAPQTPRPWPPLVGSERVPRGVRLRDWLLTILAWGAFAWMLRDAIALAYDWFREPMGQLTFLQAPDWYVLWSRLRRYVEVAALLVAWIGFWAVYRSRILRPSGQTPVAPEPLDPATLCQHYGVKPAQLQAWQAQRVLTVAVAADGGITVPEPQDQDMPAPP